MKTIRTLRLAVAMIGVVAAVAAQPALAQASSQPLRMIAPMAPGGGADAIARQVASEMGPLLDTTVVVENRPGAAGTIAMDAVARAPATPPTIGMALGSTIGVVPHVLKSVPYDTLTDLKPIAQIGLTPFVLLVNADHPAKTLEEFIALAKKNAGTYSFGSFGHGTSSHVVGVGINQSTGIDMLHVAYKGAAPAINDLLGKQVTAAVADFGSAGPHLGEGGRLRGLAVTGRERSPAYPDIPTFGELGHETLNEFVGWLGLFAPKAADDAQVKVWADAAAAAVASASVQERLFQLGYIPTGTITDEFAAIVRGESQRWGDIIRNSGIAVE